jgi:hypothetical protein
VTSSAKTLTKGVSVRTTDVHNCETCSEMNSAQNSDENLYHVTDSKISRRHIYSDGRPDIFSLTFSSVQRQRRAASVRSIRRPDQVPLIAAYSCKVNTLGHLAG